MFFNFSAISASNVLEMFLRFIFWDIKIKKGWFANMILVRYNKLVQVSGPEITFPFNLPTVN